MFIVELLHNNVIFRLEKFRSYTVLSPALLRYVNPAAQGEVRTARAHGNFRGKTTSPCALILFLLFLLPFKVNRIHKHIKNSNMTQENPHRFIYL